MAVELPSSEADVQALLESAVASRASHIRREAQTITMANVRRLLESDLGLENSALDIHKALIRQLVDEVLLSSDNVEAQEEGEEQKAVSEVPKKMSGAKRLKKSSGQKAREENGSVEDFKDLQEEGVHGEAPKKKQKEKKRRASSKEEDEDGGGSNTDMSEEEAPKRKQQKERKEKEISHSKEVGGGSNADMSEEVHVEAPKKKQQKERKEKERSHSKEVGGGSSADMTEEEVHAEAPKKQQQKKRKEKEISHSKDVGGGSSADMSEEEVHAEAPKKKQQKERKEKEISHSKEVGGGSNADMSEEEVHAEGPKKKQQPEGKEKETSHSKEVDEDGSGSHAGSEEDSDVSEVKKLKKVSPKIASVKPTQNKKIEHLKKIMKACGLTIPPQIYKRAKQQPDDEQDEFLMEEIKKILSRQGLSSNPSDKEIKAAKRKIAREKDLEGIDTTNIILEPRGRRATSQLFAPVYNPPPVEFDSEGDDEEESEDGAESSEGSEDEGKDFAVAEDPEDSD